MKRKDEIIVVRVNTEIKQEIEKYCNEADIPMSQFIREAIKKQIKKGD